MNRAEEDEQPLLIPAGGSIKGGKGASMLSGDYKQRAIYLQWAREIIDSRIAQTRAAIEESLSRRDGVEPPTLNNEEYTSLFLALQPSLPYGARQVSEQIFRWDTTATQFIAIQKSLDVPVYIKWSEEGKVNLLDIYIGEEEIFFVERKFPELEKAASTYKEYIDAWRLIRYERRLWYEDAYGFWGTSPREIREIWPTIRRLHAQQTRMRGTTPTHGTPLPARGGLARYVERLYDEGKTAQEIAIILKGKGLSRPVIGALLREEDEFIADYGQWLDKQGWLSEKPEK